MATYAYVAVDKGGKEKKGSIQAESVSKASASLKNDGLIVMSVSEAGALQRDVDLSFLQRRPKPRDLSVFCRQFVSIVDAGVSVVAALEMLSEQTENKILAAAIYDCKRSIEKGETLAESMQKHEDIFSSIFITMVEAGEASGSLDISFTRMADQFEKQAKLNATLKKAAIYPIIVAIVALGCVIAMLTFVVPTFKDMFDQLGTTLPGLTLAVLAASAFMQKYWIIVVAGIVALVVALRFAAKSGPGQRLTGRLGMKLPLFGKLTVKTASATMSRTLSTLISAGIPLIDAIEITSGLMKNIFFKEALLDAKDEVAMGSSLSEPLSREKLFPPLVYHMMKIGEETGDMDSMLTKLADYYDEEVEAATAQLMAALEPLIIVIMALVVGTIILSVILPMGQLYNDLGNL